MKIKIVECLDWPSPNKPGELLKYADKFKKDKVNLDALWAYTSQNNEDKIAAIAKKPEKLREALKAQGVSANSSNCFYISGDDKAGALVDVFKALSEANINVECADAMAGQGKFSACIWVKSPDVEATKKLLKVK